jgi:adenine C2-methylase RlmN of 23S rRNA A2503 and tRNA A37
MSNTAKAERELVTVLRKIADLERLNHRKTHLFMELKAEGVTQTRIAELAGMSDVGVALAISRHATNQAKLRRKMEKADEEERATLAAGLCELCLESEPATVNA